jgi:Na+-translocating ferredoxin:NAD+ oxidoreductase subunit G
MGEILRMVVVLTLISGCSAAALTLADKQLQPQIVKTTDLKIRGPALEKLFGKPAQEVLANKAKVTVEGAEIPIFYLKVGDQVTNLAVEAIGKGGFGGDLTLMIGVDLVNNQLTGLEVVNHSETPGVGARIEEESFRRQWHGLPLDTPAALTKDGGEVDAISGASFTSRAAIAGTNDVLAFVRDHRDEILKAVANAREDA